VSSPGSSAERAAKKFFAGTIAGEKFKAMQKWR